MDSKMKNILIVFGVFSLSLVALAEVSVPDLNFSGDQKVLHSIHKRAVVGKSTDGKEDVSGLNLAEDVNEDYPIVFNMLLFIGLLMFLATIAICAAIASMDPGRDSLIYRVTSGQRFKKDN